MAIEIIKEGKYNKKYITSCRCGCVFSFQWEDVERTDTIRNQTYMYIHCPKCGEIVTQCLEDVKTIE